ncbi:hypothetical protein SAMN04488084_105193 [Pedobacter antarcticus]|uniref:Uncharacterized protein n=1 Tax=Pedobacter antarcticus TaxID=34086 RepID=A0A1I2GNJ2_9SPHI|nr:hypothetical protein SAMN04488084_105193 [Pedobacter antarcticus]SFF18838.1 hypothetical protein SAMN03003324_02750 [Pedobacter antarcticus]
MVVLFTKVLTLPYLFIFRFSFLFRMEKVSNDLLYDLTYAYCII